MISVIIPVYNEEIMLSKNFSRFTKLSSLAQLIFVDGNSSDNSIDIAGKLGEVLTCEKGRASQMNKGARNSKGDILLFLHADSVIEPYVLAEIECSLGSGAIIGGCLTQRIDKKGGIFRVIEGLGNIRAKITGVFYGDQAIFVKKNDFLKIGGFPDVEIMEDILFTKKLKKSGKTKVLPDNVVVSPRRWEEKGILRTSLRHTFLNLLFWIGMPLDRIKNFYEDIR